MFIVKIVVDLTAGSLSLQADANDFLGDALKQALWALWHGSVPDAAAMGAVATLALVANN